MSDKRLFSIPPYAVLLPLLPVFMLYARNIGRLSLMHGLWTAGAFLAAFLGVMVLLRLVFRRPDLTDLLLAIAFAAVFLPVNFLDPNQSHFLWAAAWAGLAAVVIFWKESRRFLPAVSTIGVFVFLAPILVQIYFASTWQMRAEIRAEITHAFDDLPASASAVQEKPDIYYIIFDRYARGDQLQQVFNHDNSGFIGALRERGFFIADEAYSNYQRTTHSVISSLNFDYLDRLDTRATEDKSDWLPLYDMLQDFRIGRFLKGQGYEIHFFGTWWEPTRRIAIADIFHNYYELPELARVIYEYSLIVKAGRLAGFRPVDPLWWQCQRSRLMFETLGNLRGGGKPKFVFAHFLIPHPPFVTHETGRCMDIDEALSRSRRENYVGQLKYANWQIIAMIDRLLAAPGLKPIIILQADEGPWPEKYAGDEVTVIGRDFGGVEWLKATPAELREKMGIFSAMYLPGIDTAHISAATSPVNTFRRILKSYFEVAIEELPDRHMVYESRSNLYQFHDVTGKLLFRQLSDRE
jgi:sulfatase-like protein